MGFTSTRTHCDGGLDVGIPRIVLQQLQQRLRAQAGAAAGVAAAAAASGGTLAGPGLALGPPFLAVRPSGMLRWLRLVACFWVEHLKAIVGSSSRRYLSQRSATSLGTRSAAAFNLC